MLSEDITIVIHLVRNAWYANEIDSGTYSSVIEELNDMFIDAQYTEECQRENELEALEAYNCLGVPQWCGKCYVCKAYGIEKGRV